MKKFHRQITLERLEKFNSQQYFQDVNLVSCLYKPQIILAELSVFPVPDLKRM